MTQYTKDDLLFATFMGVFTLFAIWYFCYLIAGPDSGSYRKEVKGVGEWVCIYDKEEWRGETITKCIELKD